VGYNVNNCALMQMMHPYIYKIKKELHLKALSYGFSIGTISKVKKIVLGSCHKIEAFRLGMQIYLYV
jgi:hypothetical protein